MSDSTSFESHALCCPHVTVKGNDIAPAWRVLHGAIINLPGDKKLILCEECFHVVRSHVIDSFLTSWAVAAKSCLTA